MSELTKIRMQILNAETDEVLEEVDVLSSASSILFPDGKNLEEKITQIEKAEGPQGPQGPKGDTGEKGDTGATGQRGSAWYEGTGITGTDTSAKVFSGSGVTSALANDKYLNRSTGAVYNCIAGGTAGTATWAYIGNIKGPQGAKGDTGATGPQGPKGDTGATGEKGATGATGPQGAKGDTGNTGQRGSNWYQGTGITGTSTVGTVFSSSGVTNALVNDKYLNTTTGAVYNCTVAGNASAAKWVYVGSIKGPTGAKGETGAQGPQGIQGPKGDTGATGAKGATGAQGPQGPKGEDGDKIKFGTSYATASDIKLFFKKVER